MRLLFFDDYKMGVVKMEVENFGPLQVSVRSYGPEKLERWAPPGTKKA